MRTFHNDEIKQLVQDPKSFEHLLNIYPNCKGIVNEYKDEITIYAKFKGGELGYYSILDVNSDDFEDLEDLMIEIEFKHNIRFLFYLKVFKYSIISDGKSIILNESYKYLRVKDIINGYLSRTGYYDYPRIIKYLRAFSSKEVNKKFNVKECLTYGRYEDTDLDDEELIITTSHLHESYYIIISGYNKIKEAVENKQEEIRAYYITSHPLEHRI